MYSQPEASGSTVLSPPRRGRLDRMEELTPLPHDALLWSRAEGYTLELGGRLRQVSVRYQAYGRLNAQGDNAILIFHALSGSAHLAGRYSDAVWARLSAGEQAFGREGWWDALVGPGKLFDTDRYYVICANHLGSCYGSTGPLTRDLANGRRYGPEFPTVTVRDLARVQARLLERLGVNQAVLVGGSLGGMVALEFALLFPERSRQLFLLAAPGHHGPWARAWNRLAREAIRQDSAYQAGRYREQPHPCHPRSASMHVKPWLNLIAGAVLILAGAAAVAGEPLKVGYLPVSGHAKFFIAKEQGFFAQEGLDVELIEFINSADGLNAVVAGKLDVGAFGTTAPLAHMVVYEYCCPWI